MKPMITRIRKLWQKMWRAEGCVSLLYVISKLDLRFRFHLALCAVAYLIIIF